jgi:hypothetical protein
MQARVQKAEYSCSSFRDGRPDTRVLALCNNWERVAVPYSPAEFGERLLIMELDNIARSWLNDGPTLEASPSEHDDGLDLRVLA